MLSHALPVMPRPARLNDAAVLKQIWLQFMQMHEQTDASFALADDGLQRWEEMVLDLMGRQDTFVMVAELNRCVVGFCLGWVARNPNIYKVAEVGFISEIAVVPEARRQGVGRSLIAAARTWFQAHELDHFQLSTAVWNTEAQKFWEAVGGRPLLVRFSFNV